METVLITGASSGIGLATSKLFLQRGYRVLGSVRNETDAHRLRQTLAPPFHPLVFDVCDRRAITGAAAEAKDITGGRGLACLMNNAGIAVSGPLQHLPEEEFRRQFEVNVFGVLWVTQAFLPLLGAQEGYPLTPGKIINISSISGILTLPFVGPYAASKHALESLSDALRRELLLYGIDVIVIQPGPIKTPIWDKARNEKQWYAGTDYAPLLKNREQLILNAEKRALPAERVARLILTVMNTKRPRTRYLIMNSKWRSWLAARAPDRWIDFFIKKGMRRILERKE